MQASSCLPRHGRKKNKTAELAQRKNNASFHKRAQE